MGKIEWTDRSDWNPVRGCTRVSPGCGGPGPHGGCYAEAMAARFSDPGMWGHGFAERTASGPRWTGKVELQEDRLALPLSWRTPARIFANSTSDLFHEALSFDDIDRAFEVMALARQHTFQVLTKRVDRMREYFGPSPELDGITRDVLVEGGAQKLHHERTGEDPSMWLAVHWPLPNVWLGASVEDRARKDRIDALREIPAAVRFLSLEPLLEDIGDLDLRGIGWCIVGGESGPNARPLHIGWVRSIIAQCKAAGVACFVKQIGANPHEMGVPLPILTGEPLRNRKGGDWTEWPDDLRVREFPDAPR